MPPLALTILIWCLVVIVALITILAAIGLICLIVIVITACLGAIPKVWQESTKEKK